MSAPTDIRLPAFVATDVILSALQATFATDNLIDGANPYRFIPDDPARSAVWVCDPESRQDIRDGNRMIIMVERGEYAPNEMSLMNRQAQSFQNSSTDLADLAQTPLLVTCEAGNKIASEVLASIVYRVIKMFRMDLMREYDIFSIKVNGIGAPMQVVDAAGKPWRTVVSLRLYTQEQARMTELANHLNTVTINERLEAQGRRVIASLDATPP